MTRFRYYTAMTLDGFLADEHDNLDWLLSQPIDDDGPGNHADFMAGVGALVMGATTYQWVVDHEVTDDTPWPYSEPAFVFTHRDLESVAPSIRFVAGDPADVEAQVRAAAGDKDVWIVGGGAVAARFADAGMLDDIIVSIAPVTLGAGRRLFDGAYDLILTSWDRNGAFLCATYDVVGARTAAAG